MDKGAACKGGGNARYMERLAGSREKRIDEELE